MRPSFSRVSEMGQKAVLHANKLYVRQQLNFMNSNQLVNAFELQDDLVFDQNIHTITTIQTDPVEFQFVGQAPLIGRFKQAGPKHTMEIYA